MSADSNQPERAPDEISRIPRIFRRIASALELVGENRFRAQAYRRGADALETVEDELPRLTRENRLYDLPGIGKALAAQVAEILATGRSAYLETVSASLPPGALDLAEVPGLSLPQIKKLAGSTSSPAARHRTPCSIASPRTHASSGWTNVQPRRRGRASPTVSR